MRVCVNVGWMHAITKRYDGEIAGKRAGIGRSESVARRINRDEKKKGERVHLHMSRVCHLINSRVANAMSCRFSRHKFRRRGKAEERGRMCVAGLRIIAALLL